MEMEIIVVAAVVTTMIALVIMVVGFARKRIQKRKEDLQALATHFDMDYYAADDANRIKGALRDFKLFSKGRGHKVTNLMISRMGHLQQIIFDFRCASGDSEEATQKYLTILVIECPDADLPSFTLSREFKAFRKMSNFLGMDDIDFESHKTFSDQYLLKGEDESRIRETFNDSVLDFFTEHPGWTVEGGGRYLAIFQKPTLLKAEEKPYQELMDIGEELSELFFEGHYG